MVEIKAKCPLDRCLAQQGRCTIRNLDIKNDHKITRYIFEENSTPEEMTGKHIRIIVVWLR